MRARSAVQTMLQDRADDDRAIIIFPPTYRKDASPYSQNVFSPTVRAVCSSARRPVMSGLRIAKVIFLGDVAVGKTCLVNRFCNRVFDANYKATIGVDFEVERFDILQVPYNLQIWDTAGQERFKCIASSYYRAANAIVLVFDMTNPSSLLHCAQWLHEAMVVNTRGNRPFIFLVGTKRDLLCSEACAVAEARAANVARQLGAELWTLSSRTGEYVKEFFFRVAALTFDSAVLREIETRDPAPKIGTELVTLNKSSLLPASKQRKKCDACF